MNAGFILLGQECSNSNRNEKKEEFQEVVQTVVIQAFICSRNFIKNILMLLYKQFLSSQYFLKYQLFERDKLYILPALSSNLENKYEHSVFLYNEKLILSKEFHTVLVL